MVRAARDSNPNRQIRRLVLCVDLVGSRGIWPAHVGCVVDPDGSRGVPSDRLDDQTVRQITAPVRPSTNPSSAASSGRWQLSLGVCRNGSAGLAGEGADLAEEAQVVADGPSSMPLPSWKRMRW